MLTVTERAWLRLHLTRSIGRLGLFQLQATFKSPEAILQAAPDKWPDKIGRYRVDSVQLIAEHGPEFEAALTSLEQHSVRIISFWDDAYPEMLKNIHDPPALLYVRGELHNHQALAVVGSRRSSTGGQVLTRKLCHEVAQQGITIVSGLARGIDSAAHEGALDANGDTVAVLGCGIDQIYPKENRRLFHRIIEQGAIISEYPPGTAPLPGHFPGRNRIISGLSQGVLIVEAAKGSGSLITAEFALEQGRDVFAIPGTVTLANSSGVNSLLKDGAHLVTEASDILNILRPGVLFPDPRNSSELPEGLTDQERRLVTELSHEPLQIDDLARKSGLTPMELSAILLQLELRGTVSQLPGMRYIRCF